jgi:hypothetical protein
MSINIFNELNESNNNQGPIVARRRLISTDLLMLIINIITMGSIYNEEEIRNNLMNILSLNGTSLNNQKKKYQSIHYTIKVLNEILIHNFRTNTGGEYLHNRINSELSNLFKNFCINDFHNEIDLSILGININNLNLTDDKKIRCKKIFQFIVKNHQDIIFINPPDRVNNHS